MGAKIQSGSHDWAHYLLGHDTFQHARLASGTAENIGWVTCRSDWARDLKNMWLASYEHRIHLLSPSFTRIGVGVAGGSWSGWGCVRIAVTRFR